MSNVSHKSFNDSSAVTVVDAPEALLAPATMVDHALLFSGQGFYIFPADPVKKKGLRAGEYTAEKKRWGATKDPDTIRQYWTELGEAAIGVSTGKDNRIFVVEVDTLVGGHAADGAVALAALEAKHGPLPATRESESPTGSVHRWWRYPDGLEIKNSANEIGSGIDVRGEGGMVIAPPSWVPDRPASDKKPARPAGAYKWRNDLPIADAPQWLLDLVVASKEKPKRAEPTERTVVNVPPLPDVATYVERVSHREYHNVAQAPAGRRNHQLNISSLILGKYVGSGELDEQKAIQTMLDACKVNGLLDDGEDKCLATIESGLKKGKSEPAKMPLPDHPELTAPQANLLDKFWAHLPSGKIIHAPSRLLWAAGSFDKHIGRIKVALATGPGMLASTWSSQNRFVHSMGWAPGEPMIVKDRILTDDGWIRVPGERSFNLYLPPDIEHVEGDVSRWLDLIKFIYPEEWQHILEYFAFKVQNPGIKINHGLVFIGTPGIGKDTIVEPVIAAIGPHNFQGVPAPVFFNSDFNGYLKAVLLRIDEVHDLGGESKYAFHDRTKTVIAAPPPSHRINVKHVPHHAALNVNGTIETSNHWDALYLPADDRRHFVCISERRKEDFSEGYFTGTNGMYAWFGNGGNEAVAHYLANLDISAFDAKADPPKTSGWHRIVNAGLAPEGGELLDIIEALGKPAALTLGMIRDKAPYGTDLRLVFDDPKRRRAIPKRLAEVGYVAVLNRDAADGRWPAKPVKTMIYARQELSEHARQTAARFRAAGFSPPWAS
jgi:hypothetical protein